MRALEPPFHGRQGCGADLVVLPLVEVWVDDHVDQPVLVLQQQEGDPLGGHQPLPADDPIHLAAHFRAAGVRPTQPPWYIRTQQGE